MEPVDAWEGWRRSGPAAVYVLLRLDRVCAKVGWSYEPVKRAKQLPEYEAGKLDLAASQVLWFPNGGRARQAEATLHKALRPMSAQTCHARDGYSEWFNPRAVPAALQILTHIPIDDSGELARLVPLLSPCPYRPREFKPSADMAKAWGVVEAMLESAAVEIGLMSQRCGNDWCFVLPRFRGWQPSNPALRMKLVDLNSYGHSADGGKHCLAAKIEYVGDDLVVSLPSRALLVRMPGGMQVLRLVDAFAKRIAMHYPRCEHVVVRQPGKRRANPLEAMLLRG